MADFFDWRVAHLVLERSTTDRPLCLDLRCGPGAISFALARLGFDTVGVDSSAAMADIPTEAATESDEGNGRCTSAV